MQIYITTSLDYSASNANTADNTKVYKRDEHYAESNHTQLKRARRATEDISCQVILFQNQTKKPKSP